MFGAVKLIWFTTKMNVLFQTIPEVTNKMLNGKGAHENIKFKIHLHLIQGIILLNTPRTKHLVLMLSSHA